ncbi:MAG: 2-amino-4-hydroxy-6-hydroxymethyldihydropteridine diphosphokinase [Phycisphaerae bacterium]
MSPSSEIGIYIALGANLGPRAAALSGALQRLAADGDIRVAACSSFHETDAVVDDEHDACGSCAPPRFLNAAARLETALPPRELLSRLAAIESEFGRDRAASGVSRSLDLDLLIHHDRQIDEPGLCVPHPRMWARAFVLTPLSEIADLDRLRRFQASLSNRTYPT